MSGSRSKKERKNVRRALRAAGFTPDHFRRQVVEQSTRRILEGLKKRPSLVPSWTWRRIVLRVLDLETLGLDPDKVLSQVEGRTEPSSTATSTLGA